MKTYLLDTDILIDYFSKNNQAVQLVEKLNTKNKITISVIAVTELRAGWSNEKAAFYLPRLYAITEVIPLTQEIAELAGKFRFEYMRKGKSIPPIDTLMAATAIINTSCLVTRNIRHYPMPEVELYKKMGTD